jgi:hypothetical protein
MVSVVSGTQRFAAEAVVRGAGAAAVKSAPLSLVSVQPSPALNAAVVFDSPGAAAVPSK